MESTLTAEQYLGAYARVQAGETPAAVARDLGVHRNNLYGLLRRRGATVPESHAEATVALPDEPAVLGYLAGIMDGEGSLYKRSQDGRWYIKVGMTDEALIRWLHAFGGTFSVERRPLGRKTAYLWCVSRRTDVRYTLEVLLPYLRVKRDLAVRALAEERDR